LLIFIKTVCGTNSFNNKRGEVNVLHLFIKKLLKLYKILITLVLVQTNHSISIEVINFRLRNWHVFIFVGSKVCIRF